MGAKTISILPLFACSQVLFGQLQDTIILNTPLTGTHDIVATKYVSMIPGFSYMPSSGNTFIVRIEPGEPQSPGYDLIGGPGGAIGELVGNEGVVGAIPAQFSVSQVGGAVYNIPIECPVGINGLTPSISLVYNSQTGNGSAGWGWNIAGISSISRTGKSYYYDQDAEGVKWDGTDNFNFDGQRLFIKTLFPSGASTTTADSIEYVLDNDLSTRIVGYNYSDGGPNSFKVWTSQGRIFQYSQRQNLAFVETTTSYGTCIYELEDIDFTSIITTPGSYKTVSWNLTKISDRFGNDILYEYAFDEIPGTTFPAETLYYDITDVYYENPILPDELMIGEQYLCVTTQESSFLEINFRLNKVFYADSDYSINFSDSTRTDVIRGYISGQPIYNDKLITSISVKYNESNIIRKYELMYSPCIDYSKLLKITLTGLSNEKLNSTVFNWEETTYSCDISSTYTFASTSQSTFRASQGYSELYHLNYPADFNGDGITDFLVYYKYENSSGANVYDWAGFINPGTPGQLQNCGEGTMPLDLKFYLFDRDNDGKTEVYIQHFGTNGPYLAYARFEGYKYNGNSIVRDSNLDFTLHIGGSPYEVKLINSDFDGDGKNEFLLLRDTDLTFCSSLDFPDPPRGTVFSVPFSSSNGFFLSDINGNGKKEIIFLKTNRIEVWEYNKSTYEFRLMETNYSANKDDFFYNGDFNGDGNEDVLIRDYSAQTWFILTSNGKYWQTGLITAPSLPFDIYCGEEMYMVLDVNQDGKSDIIESHYTGVGVNYELKYYIFKENSFILALTRPVGPPGIRYPGEANTDLTTDIFSGQHNPWFYSLSTNKGFHEIDTIYDGVGNKVSIGYIKNFTKYGTNYTKEDEITGTSILSAPVLLKTVSSVEDRNSTFSFDFSDPVIHVNGKGFLGFGQINKTITKNSLSSQTSESYGLVSKGINQYELLPDTVINRINGHIVSNSYISYQTKTVYNKTYLVTSETTSQNIVDNTKTVSNYLGHDNLLFPLVISTKSFADNVEEASAYDSLTYSHNTNSWLIGQLTRKTTLRQRPGVPNYRRTYDFTYYPNGSLNEEYTEMGSTKEIKTTYSYDSFGNIASTSIVASQDQNDSRTRTVSYTYSSDGRFPTSKTDVLGNIQTYEYYPEAGLQKKITDANDFVTEYHYDGFGRLTSTIYPDANETNSILAWAQNDSDAPDGSMYARIEESSGNAPQKVFYDKYGKELRLVSYGLTGNAIYVDTQYDLSDRVSQASIPYFTGGSALWTTYDYDSYNRIEEVQTADGNTTSYAYSPGQTTVTTETTSGNRSTTTKTNSLGEVIESTDNGNNTVLKAYYASGLPKQISLAGAQFATTIIYDIYGNRTSLSDPDAGAITSEYNALGYLITQTDNNGNLTTNTYDKSGRLLTSVQDTVTTTYTYDSQIIGQISSADNGYSSVTYDYDDLGRLESLEETLVEIGGNKSFTQSFTYDECGRLKTKTWSGGYGITFDYNNYGYLYRIRDENYTLWNGTAQNAYGQYTAFNQGSHNTSVTYNAFGELDQMLTAGVRNMDYSFNRVGNLSSREDLISNQKEIFEYDGLNRLTGIDYYLNNNHVASGDKSIYFDDLGNITGKTGIAACDSILYGENGYGPHALTTIWHSAGYLPPNQEITYTSFNKVNEISDTLSGSIIRKLNITYGYDNQRRKSVYTDGAITKTKYFIGDYEEHTQGSTTKKYFFINSPTGLCGIYVIEGSNPGQLYYTCNDHLGSITEIVNATSANVTRQSVDAWGNPRSVTDWTSPASYELFAGRGFTGHEHLAEFALINMNGRFYDPMLGRFLSPDPYIQLPDFSQSFNRYTYCVNNPLKYTDPDGEFFWLPIIIGAAIFGTANTVIQYNNGEIDNFWDGLNAFVGGAVTGAVIGATWSLGIAGITSGNTLAQIGGWTIAAGKGINAVSTISSTIADPGNAAEIWFGRGYTDGNRNMLGQAWQGISRYTWEGLQSWVGYNYSQLRNSAGKVDEVKYFGGATFAIDENVTRYNGWRGVSLGNYIDAKIPGNLDEDYPGGWIYSEGGLFWHEYGHTFDSQLYGLSYLLSIGLPSARGAEWTERRANNWAWKYAKKHKYMDEWMYPYEYPLK